jgi:hypothetical protein
MHRNTILNYVRFYIPPDKLNKHYINIKKTTQFILYTNNIKPLDSIGQIFLNGFIMTHILKDDL